MPFYFRRGSKTPDDGILPAGVAFHEIQEEEINRNLKHGLTLALATTVVLVVVAELVLREHAGKARDRLRARIDTEKLCTTASPNRRLIYTYVPGRCGVNSHGYVDRERSFEKPERVYRILIIGDSVAQGRDVEISERFGSVLEAMLNERGGGVVYEVIVLARVGYSTSQELAILEDDAPRYQPDLILWSYCLNDPAHPIYHSADGGLGAFYYRPASYLAETIRRAAFRLQAGMNGRGCPEEFHARVHCTYAKEVSAALGRIGETSAARGVPVVLMIHPVFEEGRTFAEYSFVELHRRLAEVGESAGLLVCDLLATLAPHAPDEIKIHNDRYYDPWHFNALGHQLMAEGIYDFMVDNGIAP